ncbi:MAG: hypothetical protein K6F46_09100 [Desulfovibrio sp.]|nr:hypothetical protein [Desulfovibrio sp.]
MLSSPTSFVALFCLLALLLCDATRVSADGNADLLPVGPVTATARHESVSSKTDAALCELSRAEAKARALAAMLVKTPENRAISLGIDQELRLALIDLLCDESARVKLPADEPIEPFWTDAPPPPAPRLCEAEVTIIPAADLERRFRLILQRKEILDFQAQLLADAHELCAAMEEIIDRARRQANENAASRAFDSAPRAIEDALLEKAAKLKALRVTRAALSPSEDGWLAMADNMETLEKAARDYPENALILTLLGEMYLRRDLPQLSIETSSSALEKKPDMPRARYVRALAHWRLQQPALAEVDLSAALGTVQGHEEDKSMEILLLRSRGAIRMLHDDEEGMCGDFHRACVLGDCEGLSQTRAEGRCLPENATPDAAKREVQ